MESTIQILIYLHAAFGGIALLAGAISMIVKKGNTMHKTSGLWFYYVMILSGVLALIVTLLPNHRNPFLFAVGIFSLYFVISGNRALAYKNSPNLKLDYVIAWIMLVTGVLMIVLPIIFLSKLILFLRFLVQ